MADLTDKQKRFCEEYLIDLNATQAAIRAGYSENTAQQIGSENLKKKYIKKHIDKRKSEQMQELKDSNLIPINKELFEALIVNFTTIKEFRSWVSYVVSKEAILEGFNEGKIKRKALDSTTRYNVLERAGFKCQACGNKPSKNNDVSLAVDHIIPLSIGGSDLINNLQVLCVQCNISKSNNHSFNHNTEDYFNLQ